MKAAMLKNAFASAKALLPRAKPFCALVLGSGWGEVATAFRTVKTVEYRSIPGLGCTGVAGHAGRLSLAEFAGFQILIFQGRRHWYEGAGWEPVAIPVYISLKFGVSVMVFTNAAGGINTKLRPGSLMLIRDHINMIGNNPLIGNNDPVWGPMFADQTNVYAPALCQLMLKSAKRRGIRLSCGTYAALSGPTYETPAEIIALRRAGADAVGMSTVPEAMLANAAGMRVAAISCIANAAANRSSLNRLNHKDVVDTTSRTAPAIRALLTGFLEELAANEPAISKKTGR